MHLLMMLLMLFTAEGEEGPLHIADYVGILRGTTRGFLQMLA